MYDWQKVLINPQLSLHDAMKIIEKEALRIALVVDSDHRLLGVVTDGDIRRALINRCPMEIAIDQIMNRNPKKAELNDDRDNILAVMENDNLLHMPLVDREGRVVGLETLQNLSRKHYHENIVFIMAGGFGTRLRPMTDTRPKPMLHLGNKPVLENIIKLFISSRFKNFYISVHYLADQVVDYFGDGSRWGVNIKYIHEQTPLGTAGSLSLLPALPTTLPLIVMNADILTKVNFEHLLNFHNQQHESPATVCVREYEFQVPYGVIEFEGHTVKSIREKPVQRFFVNAGIYVLNPEVLHEVKRNAYLDMPTLMEQLLHKNKHVAMFPIHEYWLDIGRMDDFSRANHDYRLHFEEV